MTLSEEISQDTCKDNHARIKYFSENEMLPYCSAFQPYLMVVQMEVKGPESSRVPCYVPQAAVPPLLYEPFSNLANNLKHGQIEATDLKFAKSFWEMIPSDAGWVSAVDVVEGAREDANHLAKLKPCIAATGYSKSFVHGDLRLCNVMLGASAIKDEDAPEYEVHIFDFDWQERKEQLCILN
ncbi:hypothetical protein SELMODRAFT_431718 [Selaginella moellendorffii]|uniref:Uncharacterized protein n=1 Tax=Selaginella moellendorffii TaxID=88036 RepID=D8TDK1_SELML|nr:hypothetical protein SELMODRAFT_431718 [Selaginella moellendorffii]